MTDSNVDKEGRRLFYVAGIAVLVVAAAGFFRGTREAPTVSGYSLASSAASESELDEGALPRIPAQGEMGAFRYRERQQQQALAFAAMAEAPRGLTDPVPLSPEQRAQVLAARAEHRAYNGAPPTVPHPVDTFGAPACLTCHADGAVIEERIAPPISHEPYASCVQCHAAEDGLPFLREGLPPSVSEVNSFVGEEEPRAGIRAWPAAPPTMPHRSFMREVCASCHGVFSSGISSSHPWRQSCTQCHAPSSPLDQMPRSTFAPLPGLGQP